MLKVLFVGGTGIISSACSELAVKKDINLYHLNRGQSNSLRPVKGVKEFKGNIRENPDEVKKIIDGMYFDAVVDFIAFTPGHIKEDIEIFKNKCDQFVFISSASAYETPPSSLPVTESTPLINPYWQYSRDKIACEVLLRQEYEKSGFPYTIVRPSHTYDKTIFPFEGNYTVFNRIKNRNKIIIHGDGSSIWPLTYNKDFAKGFTGLLGNKKAITEDFHITSNHWLSWFQIYKTFADVLGVELDPVFVPSNIIANYDKQIGDSLLGDKTHSMIFDNSKIKKFVPDFTCETTLKQGAKEIIDWYDNNPGQCIVDKDMDLMFDKIISDYQH